jgi:hypothetical protein
MIIHSDSTSAISRAGQSGTGPGQQRAKKIQGMVAHFPHQYQSAEITWVKGHAGTPGNERADALAGMAVGRTSWSPFTSLAHLKLRISEKFQKSKKEWDIDPWYFVLHTSLKYHSKVLSRSIICVPHILGAILTSFLFSFPHHTYRSLETAGENY